MRSFLLKISSPEGDLFCGDVVKIRVRGTEGELAVMAGHIPFVSYVRPCDCKIEFENGDEKVGRMQSGVLTVAGDKVILISGNFIWE